MMLMVGGGHGANAVVLAWAQKTMLRPRIKRAAAVAFVNAFGNISQVWTSYLYPDTDKPRYVSFKYRTWILPWGHMGLDSNAAIINQRVRILNLNIN
ncbi:hypothetical protein CGCVW01_v012233 [Colletotrichum viniferum]|nr:hypothetical protein CGCVW01_v012233 [Colletotrichum viniferum]